VPPLPVTCPPVPLETPPGEMVSLSQAAGAQAKASANQEYSEE
jgi:hypothetical protein